MPIVAIQVDVDDMVGGTPLHTEDQGGISGSRMVVKNASNSNTVALGPFGVTFANGYPLDPGDIAPLNLSSGGQLYGICDNGRLADVRVLKLGE